MIAARYDAVSRVWFLQDSMEEWWITTNEEDLLHTSEEDQSGHVDMDTVVEVQAGVS